MPRNLKRNPIRPIEQISESHCGPAVLEMLIDNLGVEINQEQITKAARAEKTIEEMGTRVDQLALATHILTPQFTFWYKERASLNDLRTVINDNLYPAGVEWQGLFEDRIEDESDAGDYGHYSIITKIDDVRSELIIIDPYKDFVKQARIVPINIFLPRWWDWNVIVDPISKKSTTKKDQNLFFIVTVEEKFPIELNMVRFTFNA